MGDNALQRCDRYCRSYALIVFSMTYSITWVQCTRSVNVLIIVNSYSGHRHSQCVVSDSMLNVHIYALVLCDICSEDAMVSVQSWSVGKAVNKCTAQIQLHDIPPHQSRNVPYISHCINRY